MAITEERQGKEKQITGETAAESMMDALSLVNDIKPTAGSVNQEEYKRYEVHTHPENFGSLSVNDMLAYASDITKGGDYPDGMFTATMTNEGLVLGGLHTEEMLDGDRLSVIQRDYSLIKKPGRVMTTMQKEATMLNAFEEAGFDFCSVVFPRKGG